VLVRRRPVAARGDRHPAARTRPPRTIGQELAARALRRTMPLLDGWWETEVAVLIANLAARLSLGSVAAAYGSYDPLGFAHRLSTTDPWVRRPRPPGPGRRAAPRRSCPRACTRPVHGWPASTASGSLRPDDPPPPTSAGGSCPKGPQRSTGGSALSSLTPGGRPARSPRVLLSLPTLTTAGADPAAIGAQPSRTTVQRLARTTNLALHQAAHGPWREKSRAPCTRSAVECDQ
jgi:hypothetical protein